MLMRGTTKHNRQEIEDTLDRLRAKVGIGGSETVDQRVAGETTRGKLAGRAARSPPKCCASRRFPAAEFEQAEARDDGRARREPHRSRQHGASVRSRASAIPYPKGDVRYEPTLDEELADTTRGEARRREALPRAVRRRRRGGARDRRRLRRRRGQGAARHALRRVEEPVAVRARAGAARGQARPRRSRSRRRTRRTRRCSAELALPLNDASADYPAACRRRATSSATSAPRGCGSGCARRTG